MWRLTRPPGVPERVCRTSKGAQGSKSFDFLSLAPLGPASAARHAPISKNAREKLIAGLSDSVI